MPQSKRLLQNEPSNRSTLQPTRLPDSALSSDVVTSITGAGLDSSSTRPTNSHLPVLVQKSARKRTDNTKTDIVVTLARMIVVAGSRTAFVGIVVPRTTAQHLEMPTPGVSIQELAGNLSKFKRLSGKAQCRKDRLTQLPGVTML